MKKYRFVTKAHIYPQNANEKYKDGKFIIYIPDHILYDTEQSLTNSKTRWDYSFGMENNDVVILIRHISIIDETCMEIRNMPEFYYDYETFCKLGGYIDYVVRTDNTVNIERFNERFSVLFPNMEEEDQIHIEPIELVITEYADVEEIPIPHPFSHIAKFTVKESGNYNCNRPMIKDFFFDALETFEPNSLQGKDCYLGDGYLSADSTDKSEIYDASMNCVLEKEEWVKRCYDANLQEKKRRKDVLEKHGLLDAYTSLQTYFLEHNTIPKIKSCGIINGMFVYKKIEVDLSYGYIISGFTISEEAVIWRVNTYERAVKENDCLRGMDECHLMYKNGKTVAVESKVNYMLLQNQDSVTDMDYEKFRDVYVEIN